jgi:hypothetical protein
MERNCDRGFDNANLTARKQPAHAQQRHQHAAGVPPMIIATNFVPAGFDAITLWPVILVRPGQRGNIPLIEHELVHYREQAPSWLCTVALIGICLGAGLPIYWWLIPLSIMANPAVWGLRYLLSKKFRLAAEVRAYRRQIELGGITAGQAAQMLTRYRLGITLAQAQEALA